MDVKTYRAKTMQDALAIVRRELGGGASVLHTRAVEPSAWMRWLGSERMIEVVASATISAPSRLRSRKRIAEEATVATATPSRRQPPPIAGIDLLTISNEQFRREAVEVDAVNE